MPRQLDPLMLARYEQVDELIKKGMSIPKACMSLRVKSSSYRSYRYKMMPKEEPHVEQKRVVAPVISDEPTLELPKGSA